MATPFEDEEQEQPEQPLETGGDEDVVVPFEEPPKEEDEEEPRKTRQEKKSERFQQAIDAAEEARREAAQARAELQALQQRVQQIPSGQDQPDPREQEIENLYRQRQILQREYFARARDKDRPLSQQETEEYEKRARELEDKYIDARNKRLQPEQVDPRMAQMAARYPDILSDPRTRAHANGLYYIKIAKGKNPDSWDTWDEIAEETRREYRLGKYKTSQPTDAERSAYTGAPRGGGPVSDPKPSSIKMTKEFRIMANEMFKHIPDEKKRLEMWARGPGRAMLESKK